MNTQTIPKVIDQIRFSEECTNAIRHYTENENMSEDVIRKNVIKRGTADFDVPYNGEDRTYIVEAYIHCFLKMHYSANRAIFSKCNFINAEQIAFIDFGCGPMTSGLALLAALGKTHAGAEILYCGVDISKNMVEKASRINNEYKLFSDAYFSNKLEEAILYSEKVITKCSSGTCVAMVNFSYVLSMETVKESNIVEKLLNEIRLLADIVFRNPNHSIYVIYQNPAAFSGPIYENWRRLRCALTANFQREICSRGNVPYGYRNPIYHFAMRLLPCV